VGAGGGAGGGGGVGGGGGGVGAWMCVCCESCLLSGRVLCDELITHREESYRLR